MTKSEKKRSRKRKRKKDPNAPKRGMSSFMFFAGDFRDQVRKEHPELKITDVGKELGKMWKELGEEEKKKYMDQAAEDKKRYEAEKSTYVEPSDDESSSSSSSSDEGSKRKRKKRKKNKDPNRPKRSMSSFMFFSNANRDSLRTQKPDLKFTEVGKALSQMWKEITSDEKQKYIDMAEKDKERYKQAMSSYKPDQKHPTPSESGSGAQGGYDSSSSSNSNGNNNNQISSEYGSPSTRDADSTIIDSADSNSNSNSNNNNNNQQSSSPAQIQQIQLQFQPLSTSLLQYLEPQLTFQPLTHFIQPLSLPSLIPATPLIFPGITSQTTQITRGNPIDISGNNNAAGLSAPSQPSQQYGPAQ